MKGVLFTITLVAVNAAASAQSAQSPLTPPALKSPGRTSGVALKVGDKAPDFALPNGDGKLVALSDYTSKSPVVVVFYRGFW